MVTQITITGTVRFTPSTLPVSGVKVELWDKGGEHGWIAGTVTNKKGEFSVVINEPYASDITVSGPLFLRYKVKRNGVLIGEDDLGDPTKSIDAKVSNDSYDKAVADLEQDFSLLSYITVNGSVLDENGAPCVDLDVNVCENGFRTKTVIGSGKTDTNGGYSIQLNTSAFGNNAVAARSSIRVEALDGGSLVGASQDIFDWTKNLTVNLNAKMVSTVSEFDRIVNQITEITGATPIKDVAVDFETNTDEIKYIAGAIGHGADTIAAMVNAHQIEATSSVPADVIYALSKTTGSNVNPLLVLKGKEIKAALVTASMNNLTQAYDETQIDNIVTSAKTFQVENTKSIPIVDETYTINDLLLAIFESQDILDTQAVVNDFFQAYHDEYADLDEFWANYEQGPGDPVLAKRVRLGLKIAAITHFQPQITKKVMADLGQDHISKLATWTVADWAGKISGVCDATSTLCVPASIKGDETLPGNTDIQLQYATRMAAITQAMYPLTNIGSYIQVGYGNSSNNNNDPNQLQLTFLDQASQLIVKTFIDNNPEFDIRVTSVYDINVTDQNLAGIDVVEDLQAALVGIGRIARVVGGNPVAIVTLLNNNISSSLDISNTGWEEFNGIYGYLFPPQDQANPQQPAGPCSVVAIDGFVPGAIEVYSRAKSITDGLMASLGGALIDAVDAYPVTLGQGKDIPAHHRNHPDLPIEGTGLSIPHSATGEGLAEPHTVRMAATQNFLDVAVGKSIQASTAASTTITGQPTLANLIGSLDYASCSDCRSIYSPAAYLTDTLHFLKSTTVSTTGNNIYAAFDTKRPDIKYIDLSCENTNTPVPYIDLVNEILEAKIMASNSITTPTNFSYNTKSQLSLADAKIVQAVAGSPQALLADTRAVDVSKAQVSVSNQAAVAVGNRNISQNVINVANNNVRTSVNRQVVANVANVAPVSASVVANAAPVNVAGKQQAAYPERTYKDASTGISKDFTAFVNTSSVNSYVSVYGLLSNAVYPQALPFNMPIEESRAYLAHFGTSRLELMKLFRPVNSPTGATATNSISDFTIYAEFLGLSQVAATIVAGTHANYTSSVHLFYGGTSSTSSFPHPTTPGSTIGGSALWEDTLSSRLDLLLQQTGITYNELLQYLTTDYLNPINSSTSVRYITINPTSTSIRNDTAKLEELKLVFNGTSTYTAANLSTAFYKKLHAFIRLVRTGVMSIYHWDILFRSMGVTGVPTTLMSNTIFLQLGRILMFAKDLKIAPEQLAFWWNSADTTNYVNYPNNSIDSLSSVYQDIFNNKGVINNSNLNIFVNPASFGTATYATYAGQIANICGITESELLQLVTYLSNSSSLTSASVISLPVLSRLYILAQLSKNWSLTVADLIMLLKLSALVVPYGNMSTTTGSQLDDFLNNLQAVTDMVNAVSLSKFRVGELNYLVADVSATNATAPPPVKIQVFLESLRKELHRNPVFPGRLTGADLSDTDKVKINNSQFNNLANIIYQFFSKEFGMTLTEAKKILDVTNTSGSPDGIISSFIDSKFLQSTISLSEDVVNLVDGLSLSTGTVLTTANTGGLVIAADDLNNIKGTVKMASFYTCYRYFHKVAIVYQRLGLREKEFSYLFDLSSSSTNLPGFDFTGMPVYLVSTALTNIKATTVSSTTSTNLLKALLRVSRLMDLVNKLNLTDDGLMKILDAHIGIVRTITSVTTLSPSTLGDVNTAFGNLLSALRQDNWDTKLDEVFGNNLSSTGTITKFGTGTSAPESLLAVKYTIGSSGTSDLRPDNYKNISMVIDAIDIVTTSLQLGLQPTNLKTLLTEDVDSSRTRNLIMAVRGKYSDDAWNGIAQSLRDPIRVRQRDALVAFTRKSPDQLFADLLIDVSMDACMVTSRIKQAISSVQLFIDRVVMGLEMAPSTTTILTMPIDALRQWHTSRKWYRIWEANRKVFFYPEDWMEPELRDDKTPFFKSLEAELKQDALTIDSAERALSNYLQQLDEVARLQPVGTCAQTSEDGTVITHVICRSYGASHTYFHRTVTNNIWSPWEKMNIKIEGDHVVPFVWNNRLCIYWLTFAEKAAPFTATMNNFVSSSAPTIPSSSDDSEWFYQDPKEIGSNSTGSSASPVTNYYKQLQITLNWSEFKAGKWQNMNMGKDNIVLKLNPVLERMLYNTGNTTETGIFRKLMNNGHSSLIDFVKSRIFLYPYIHPVSGTGLSTSESTGSYEIIPGDLYLMIMFPTFNGFSVTTHAEYADYLKCFHFSGSTNMMNVLKDAMIYKRVIPTANTFFKNQAMTSVDAGNDLMNETLTTTTDSVFDYEQVAGVPYTVYVPHTSGWFTYYTTYTAYTTKRDAAITVNTVGSGAARVISALKSNFRIIPQAGFGGAVVDSPFLFEDSDNIFYVSKTTYNTPLIATMVRDRTTLFNPSFAEKRGVVKGAPILPGGHVAKPGELKMSPNTVSRGTGEMMSYGTTSFVGTVTSTYYFTTLYHHHTHVFMRMLNQFGVKGLYRPDMLGLSNLPIVQAARTSPDDDTISFSSQYSPSSTFMPSVFPNNRVDFAPEGAYSVYNWELFFHAPMLIAQRLSENFQFFEAQRWYHYIFDPTSVTYLNNDSGSGAQRFWKFFPFYQAAGTTVTLDSLMSDIRSNATNAIAQVTASSDHPFEPFMLGRLRTMSFMKNVLMKYLDNLIAWGDHLFMRDTIESINEATQIYILASNLLGKRPVGSMQRATFKSKTFNDLDTISSTSGYALDAISEACVQIESFIDPGAGNTIPTGSPGAGTFGFMNYFCVPPNNKLLTYWDTVADRLFKIRHCQNIEGVVQKLPLFDSPIDPSVLVAATAAGLSMNDVLDDVNGVNTPNYRFTYCVQKANEFVGDVKALGGALLSALEKKDAELLAILRQGQEMSLLQAVLQMKEKQVEEAKANYDAMVKSKENALVKVAHFNALVAEPINRLEQAHLQTMKDSKQLQSQMVDMQEIAHMVSLLPQFHGQFIGGVGVSFGGNHLGTAMNMITTSMQGDITMLGLDGSMYSTKGGFERRLQDWKFQATSAQLEADQLDKQIAAAKIRIDIAETDLRNQNLQIENSAKVNEYMQFKYTNAELYDWMATQISTTYYRAYQVAYKMAKKAHLCYKNELPHSTIAQTNLIQPIYWDSRRKGLLAGEQLQLDIRNMEVNYMDDNKRMFELTKHVSLAQLNPAQLATLKTKGYCSFDIPEVWYDLDYPGHINRTIKSVSLSIPCVAGPYTSVPCTLSLSGSSRRMTTYTGTTAPAASTVALPPTSMIATSTAQNDNGMFDFNFKDERYLPFEGAGAISSWTLSLFNNSSTAQSSYTGFNLDTISDVILHIKYTAQDSAAVDNTYNATRRTAVGTYLSASTVTNISSGIYTPLGRLFGVKNEFANEWFTYAQAVTVSGAVATTGLEIALTTDHFPSVSSGHTVTIGGIFAMLKPTATLVAAGYTSVSLEVKKRTGVTLATYGTITGLSSTNKYCGAIDTSSVSPAFSIASNSLSIKLLNGSTPIDINANIDNLYLVIIYKLL